MRTLVYFRGWVSVDRGTPLRCRHLTRQLAARPGAEVLIVSRDETSELARVLDIPHRPIGEGSRAPLQSLRDALQAFRPDVIYGQTHKAMADLLVCRSASAAPRVVDLHGDWPASRLEQTWRPLPRRVFGYLRGRLRERRELPRMDAFTAVGQAMAARVRRLGKPVRVLWGGVETDLFQPFEVPRTSRPEGTVEVVYAGNFRPYQGISTLIAAAERLAEQGRPVFFTFIGDAGSFPDVAQQIRQRLAGSAEILGQLPYEEMPARLASADVLVIPRPADRMARHGFPSKLPEYLATGRPVVLTEVGEQGRVVEDGKTGLLVPPGDPAALVTALTRLEDPALRASLGGAGRRLAETRLSWERIGGELHDFLTEIAARGRSEDAR